MGFKTTKYVLQAKAHEIVNKEIEITKEELEFILRMFMYIQCDVKLHKEELDLKNKIERILK